MAGVTGKEAAIAFAKFGTNSWGVAASVTKGAYFTNDGNMAPQPAYVDDNSFGQDFLGQAEVGDIASPDLTFTTRAKYDDHSYIWEALAMGSPAVAIATSAVGQTTSWRHTIDLAPSLDGLGITIAVDKVIYVDELTSAKVYGFSFTGGDGGVMDQAFKVMGSRPTNISSINTRSTVNGASFPALRNRIFRKQGTIRMNLQSAGSLGAGDAIKVQDLNFEFSRPQDAPFVYGLEFIDEPADQGFPEFTLRATYPRMNTVSAGSIYHALVNGSVFKLDCTYLGAFINSTDRYSYKFEFPHLEVQPDTNPGMIEGANQAKPTATFKAKLAGSSPSGMAFVNPVRVTRIMTQSVVAF
jgi:hypothetical protein